MALSSSKSQVKRRRTFTAKQTSLQNVKLKKIALTPQPHSVNVTKRRRTRTFYSKPINGNNNQRHSDRDNKWFEIAVALLNDKNGNDTSSYCSSNNNNNNNSINIDDNNGKASYGTNVMSPIVSNDPDNNNELSTSVSDTGTFLEINTNTNTDAKCDETLSNIDTITTNNESIGKHYATKTEQLLKMLKCDKKYSNNSNSNSINNNNNNNSSIKNNINGKIMNKYNGSNNSDYLNVSKVTYGIKKFNYNPDSTRADISLTDKYNIIHFQYNSNATGHFNPDTHVPFHHVSTKSKTAFV